MKQWELAGGGLPLLVSYVSRVPTLFPVPGRLRLVIAHLSRQLDSGRLKISSIRI